MTTDQNVLLFIALVIAVSAAMLAWFVIEVGTGTLARYRATFTERAKFQAQEFFLFIDPRQLFVANLAVMSFGGLLVWVITNNAILGFAAFLTLALLPRFLYAWMRKKRLLKFEEQLPDALLMIAGGMRSGAGLTSAIQQVISETPPPISQEFSLMVREQRLGVTLEQALSNLNRRVPTQTTTLVVSAMRIASETGGGLAETLERTSQTIRSRLQMEGKINALTAQGKLQMWVVGLLPIGLMAVLNKMEPEAMALMWSTRIGWATLVAIAILELLGFFVIKKIVTIDV